MSGESQRWSAGTAPASRHWSASSPDCARPTPARVRFSGEPAPPVPTARRGARGSPAFTSTRPSSRPDRRRESLRQSPAARARLSSAGGRRRAGARAARPMERSRREDMRGRRPHGRGAPAGRDRPCPLLRRRFIILDEPTAQLDGEEIKRLFGACGSCRSRA